jgi:hydrogenase maturation protease
MHKLRDAPGDAEEDLRALLEEIAGEGRVYVLGLGNTDRADDGAGVLVAEALKKPFPRFSFSEHDGVEGTVLDISEKKERSTVFFIDAADLKLSPGSIRVVRKEDIRETEITTHRVAVALMASILGAHGKKSAVICIQPGAIDFRGDITLAVNDAFARLVKVLTDLMSSRDR